MIFFRYRYLLIMLIHNTSTQPLPIIFPCSFFCCPNRPPCHPLLQAFPTSLTLAFRLPYHQSFPIHFHTSLGRPTKGVAPNLSIQSSLLHNEEITYVYRRYHNTYVTQHLLRPVTQLLSLIHLQWNDEANNTEPQWYML